MKNKTKVFVQPKPQVTQSVQPAQPPPPKPQIKLLRVTQVADRLNVSISTIYLWCDHGHLEKVKLTDGCMRITENSVDDIIKKGLARGYE